MAALVFDDAEGRNATLHDAVAIAERSHTGRQCSLRGMLNSWMQDLVVR